MAHEELPVPIYSSLEPVYSEGSSLEEAQLWFQTLKARFVELFGQEPEIYARSPGRVNLIGEHIDYEGYSVLPMAIRQDTIVAIRRHDAGESQKLVMLFNEFVERAENYYQKRPQLLALLEDLYNRYLYLADRYAQSLLKPLHRRQISVHSDFDDDDDPRASDPDSASSDAESSLSFQPLPLPAPLLPAPPQDSPSAEGILDMIVAELVVAAVERDLVAAEAVEAEKLWSESAWKIELQGSLLEVLESERMVLLGENARLGFRIDLRLIPRRSVLFLHADSLLNSLKAVL